MFLLMLAGLVGLLGFLFLLKAVLIMVAVKASVGYNATVGRNIQAKYQQVNLIPDWVKTLADENVYQRYSLDPLRIVAYPAFYRNGFKFFNGDHYQYAVSYDGTGKYTVYRKVRSGASGNKTKSVAKVRSKIKV
ncbi:MAG: hypothetical protein PHY07_07555 [Methanosarcina sp.]|jgi:hypothetical protein|nr:hypothetical protein [Methanosarcina sp.]